MMHGRGKVLTGIALGAGLMYLFDPERGRSRRALIGDRLVHAARAGARAIGTTRRDVTHRALDAAATLRGMLHHERVDDEVLAERVRAQLGRATSHPRAISVLAELGVVTVSGHVLAAEVPRLLRAVERVRGVREVIAAFDELADRAAIADVQARSDTSDRSPLSMWIAGRWSPAARLAAGTTAVLLAAAGALNKGRSGALLTAAGLGLMARAAVSFHRPAGSLAAASLPDGGTRAGA